MKFGKHSKLDCHIQSNCAEVFWHWLYDSHVKSSRLYICIDYCIAWLSAFWCLSCTHITHHKSHITHHTTHITHPTSHITHHTSQITRHKYTTTASSVHVTLSSALTWRFQQRISCCHGWVGSVCCAAAFENIVQALFSKSLAVMSHLGNWLCSKWLALMSQLSSVLHSCNSEHCACFMQ